MRLPSHDAALSAADFKTQIESVDEHTQAADALAAKVIERAQAAGNVISGEVRRAAVALLRRLLEEGMSPQQTLTAFLREFRAILLRYEPVLARTVSDATLAAWLQGGNNVLKLVPAPPQSSHLDLADVGAALAGPDAPSPPEWTRRFTMPGEAAPIIRFPIIDEAARDLARRKILTEQEFYAAGRLARQTGFTVSRVASLDALQKIRDLLTQAVVEGQTMPEWRKDVEKSLDGSGLSPARLENVFRSNALTAYSRGMKAVVEAPLVRSAFAFFRRVPIRDSRLTDLCEHLSASGLEMTTAKPREFFWIDDPLWYTLFAPPSHWQCRCGIIPYTLERAAKAGVKIAQEWLRTGVEPTERLLLVPQPNLRLPAGWASPWHDSTFA